MTIPVLGQPAPKVEPSELYVPDHAIINSVEPQLIGGKEQGQRTLDGKWISHRTWVLTNQENGRTQKVCLLDNEMSDDQVAAAFGEAREKFLEETKGLPKLKSYTVQERKNVGAAIRHYREFKARMRESTNNRVFYRGVK